MKVGDVVDAGEFLSMSEDSAQVLVEAIGPDGLGVGDLTFLGVKLARVKLRDNSGVISIEQVVEEG